jgi:Isocitrate dehydrogenase kinase/phosphatase (AceK)
VRFRSPRTKRTRCAEAWFYVTENDVFPQTFMNFLGFDSHLKHVFLESHGEILTAGGAESSTGCATGNCSKSCPTTGIACGSSAACSSDRL